MRIAFIVDPLAKLKAVKDSSVFMMREAAKRGHEVFAFEVGDMALHQNRVLAQVSKLGVSTDNDNWYQVTKESEMALSDFDAVLMRKDPPFDQEYLYATLLLSLAEGQGARVVNRAASLRDYNEKLAIAKFAAFTVPTTVTSDMARLHAFIDTQQDVIVKKLDGMGGTSIFRVRARTPRYAPRPISGLSCSKTSSPRSPTRPIAPRQSLTSDPWDSPLSKILM